jgi:DNA topoisomerase I
VWIAPDGRAHIQATGRDARRRKQYRYHAEWQAARHRAKYQRLGDFAECLPAARRRLHRDLHAEPASRPQVLALAVSILEQTFIRVGNREYARANGSFGLTTLLDRHVKIGRTSAQLSYRGKGGLHRDVLVEGAELARLLAACRRIPGSQLFQYVDDAKRRHHLTAAEVNRYIADITGMDFTAKDFRTWGATLTAAACLERHRDIRIGVPGRVAMRADIASVAERLGNTPAICRKSYIHPSVLSAYQDEALWRTWMRAARESGPRLAGLSARERRLLRFLRRATWKQVAPAA